MLSIFKFSEKNILAKYQPNIGVDNSFQAPPTLLQKGLQALNLKLKPQQFILKPENFQFSMSEL